MLNLIKITMEEPFVPFTKPYGMSNEQFEEEVRVAQDLHDLWLYKQSFQQSEDDRRRHEEDLWYDILYKEQMEYNYDGFIVGYTNF